LPKFQWDDLTERLAYEQATRQQRLRAEVAQARKEAQHFSDQIDRKQRDEKNSKKYADWRKDDTKYGYIQNEPDEEIKQRRRQLGNQRLKKLEQSRKTVLGSLFPKPNATA